MILECPTVDEPPKRQFADDFVGLFDFVMAVEALPGQEDLRSFVC